jgi:lipid-A-disaccharide synthase
MNKKKIFIIAGEPSGDRLGGMLVKSLRKKCTYKLDIYGIGGSDLLSNGLKPIFPISDISVMGFTSVLFNIHRLIKRIQETSSAIIKLNPDIVITIDSPDFCFRVAERVKKTKSSVKIVHYVAPQIWAWRESRAKNMNKFIDHLIAIFPFEKVYFDKYNLPCSYFGNPLVELDFSHADISAFISTNNISKDYFKILLFPGSRISDVPRLLNIFLASINNLRRSGKKIHVIIPTLDELKNVIKKEMVKVSFPYTIVTKKADKNAAYKSADVAVATSGTVSVDLAVARVPYITAKKVSFLSYLIAKILVKIKFINMINILMEKEVVPELIQKDCNPQKISYLINSLLESEKKRNEQLDHTKEALKKIGFGDNPNDKIADSIIEFI